MYITFQISNLASELDMRIKKKFRNQMNIRAWWVRVSFPIYVNIVTKHANIGELWQLRQTAIS